MKFSYTDGDTPLDGYTIKRGIGVGGFGEVYFALSDAGKEVALKKIQRNLDVELRGVRQCLNLKHVNLITLWDIRSCQYGESWVVMEYVPGPSLRDVIHGHPQGMPEDQVKIWFASTAAGVAYLHEKGIVHRDLKPGNIFCDEDEQVIKIGDYGLSKFISHSKRSGQTESVGTFHYMAPEIGKGVYGKQIDIYALAIVLYEMLAGDVPFNGESSHEIIMKHLTADPEMNGIPEPFQKVIAKSLRKDPARRYADVMEMVADLPWPDISEKSQTLITHNAVGPMASATQHVGPAHRITTRHERVESTRGAREAQFPPVIISSDQVGKDIVFGPVRDSLYHAVSMDEAISQKGEAHDQVDPVQVVGGAESIQQDEQFATRITSPSREVSGVDDEPIAQVVKTGTDQIVQWWNHANFSAPVKLVSLITAGVVVVQNSQWLLPLILVSAVAYGIYYTVRRWYVTGETLTKELTPRQRERIEKSNVRAWLKDRPGVDRTTELVGSFLVSSFACIVFNLFFIAISGELVESSIEAWARCVWFTLICIAGSWAVLAICKPWESLDGDFDCWLRRGITGSAGVVLGGIAFFSAGSFRLDLNQMAAEDFAFFETSNMVFRSVPMLPAMLIFFAVLFGILRWYRQVHPLRRTRFSSINVALSLGSAVVLSHLLNVPLVLACTFATVVSSAVQISSPWYHPEKRGEICNEIKNEMAKQN